MNLDEELKRLDEHPSVAESTRGILADYVQAWGWERTLSDLAQVASERDDGRAAGVLMGAVQFLESGPSQTPSA